MLIEKSNTFINANVSTVDLYTINSNYISEGWKAALAVTHLRFVFYLEQMSHSYI